MGTSFWSAEPTTPRIFSAGREVIFDYGTPHAFRVGGPGFVTFHAPRDNESLLPSNVFFIAPTVGAHERVPRNCVLTRAIKYSSSADRLFPRWICVPKTGFREVARVRNVVYFYETFGWPEHPFPRPMSVLEHPSFPLCWQLVLPANALIDDRGIVTP